MEEARVIANEIGYPVLVRPSYVLGGRAMEVVHDDAALNEYMGNAVYLAAKHPVLIDKYICGKEVEVDGICDGNDVLIPGIMEHIERAGVHSGDSIAIYPPQTLSESVKQTVVDYTIKLAKALKVVGLFNIQFVVDKSNRVYVIEVNPRASRTVPVLSKITGIPMVNVATRLIMGQKLSDLGYSCGLAKEGAFIAVKAPVFSFSKLINVDTFLGPEMKSTGEVMGVDKDFHSALYKAIVASGIQIPHGGNVLLSIADRNKEESVDIAKKLQELGFNLLASDGTCQWLNSVGIETELVPDDEILDYIKDDKISLVINTPTRGKIPSRMGFHIRRTAMEYNTPCITSLDTTNAVLQVLKRIINNKETEIFALDDYSHNKAKKN